MPTPLLSHIIEQVEAHFSEVSTVPPLIADTEANSTVAKYRANSGIMRDTMWFQQVRMLILEEGYASAKELEAYLRDRRDEFLGYFNANQQKKRYYELATDVLVAQSRVVRRGMTPKEAVAESKFNEWTDYGWIGHGKVFNYKFGFRVPDHVQESYGHVFNGESAPTIGFSGFTTLDEAIECMQGHITQRERRLRLKDEHEFLSNRLSILKDAIRKFETLGTVPPTPEEAKSTIELSAKPKNKGGRPPLWTKEELLSLVEEIKADHPGEGLSAYRIAVILVHEKDVDYTLRHAITRVKELLKDMK
jgi:hypothetical protein